jgi:hypothetical protein
MGDEQGGASGRDGELRAGQRKPLQLATGKCRTAGTDCRMPPERQPFVR